CSVGQILYQYKFSLFTQVQETGHLPRRLFAGAWSYSVYLTITYFAQWGSDSRQLEFNLYDY
ncbi:MAG: hypothetical protein AAF629_33050, partial [Chloroflexota bacterium]